jgi:hypothetical protein
MPFLSTRRKFFATATGAAGVLFGAQVHLSAAGLQHTPQPLQSPNAPTNQNAPAGMNQYPSENPQHPPKNNYSGVQLSSMVQRLFQMTLELKQETDATNLQNILPADFLKKTQQIEKLAKAIRQYAGG